MGSLTLLLPVVAVFLMVCIVDSAPGSRCPPPEQVYVYSKKEECHSDSQCRGGKVCCLTPSRTRSCVQPGFGVSGAGAGYDRYKSGGTGVYCGNVKCRPNEVCRPDKLTKRLKCSSY